MLEAFESDDVANGFDRHPVFHLAAAARAPVAAVTDADHTKTLARVLFQNYLLPFEVVSLVLLAALVGVIVLIRTRTGDVEAPGADNV